MTTSIESLISQAQSILAQAQSILAQPTPTQTPAPVVTPPSSLGPLGIPGTWTLKFFDEFDGTALDTTKWSTGWLASGVTRPVQSSELQCYDPACVSVSGGYLNLAAIDKPQIGKQYSSGMVNSSGKFSFSYGAIEFRANLPGSGGKISNWPALWCDGNNWPTDGELDVMEGLGGSAAYHFHSPSGGPGGTVQGDFTGWHTYAANWQPGKCDFYFDGNHVGSVTSGITSAPQFVIINYAIGAYGGPVSAPETMQVDYVRVWQ